MLHRRLAGWVSRAVLGEREPPENHGRPIYLGGPVWHRIVLGYCILAVGCLGGLYLAYDATQSLDTAIKTNQAKIRTNGRINRHQATIIRHQATIIRRQKRAQLRVNHEVCLAVNNINGAITQTIRRSKKNLDRLAYYREHPDERAEQLREIDRTLSDFKPRTC